MVEINFTCMVTILDLRGLFIDLVAYWNDAVQNVFEGIGCTVEEAKSELNARVAQALVKGFDTELM